MIPNTWKYLGLLIWFILELDIEFQVESISFRILKVLLSSSSQYCFHSRKSVFFLNLGFLPLLTCKILLVICDLLNVLSIFHLLSVCVWVLGYFFVFQSVDYFWRIFLIYKNLLFAKCYFVVCSYVIASQCYVFQVS